MEEIKKSIEEQIKNWKKILDEKDRKIYELQEEVRVLREKLDKKKYFSPEIKEKIMDDVNRIVVRMNTEMKKDKMRIQDLEKQLASLKTRNEEIAAERDALSKQIEEVRVECERKTIELKKEYEKILADEREKLNSEFKEKLAQREKEIEEEASRQIGELMKIIEEYEK